MYDIIEYINAYDIDGDEFLKSEGWTRSMVEKVRELLIAAYEEGHEDGRDEVEAEFE